MVESLVLNLALPWLTAAKRASDSGSLGFLTILPVFLVNESSEI